MNCGIELSPGIWTEKVGICMTCNEAKETNIVGTKGFRAFYNNAYNIIYGSIYYLTLAPGNWWLRFNVLIARIWYVFYKRGSINVKTPEGITLENAFELINYSQIFIEGNLFCPTLFSDARSTKESLIVIDVGAAIGLFPKWLDHYLKCYDYYGFEPDYSKLLKAMAVNKQGCIFHKQALDNKEHSLDSYGWNSCFLLKIDTDGSNVQVLLGAHRLLLRTRHVLIEAEEGLNFDYFFSPHIWDKQRLSYDDYLFSRRSR
jgi:hypothetical protein